jgi:hypothetical protein
MEEEKKIENPTEETEKERAFLLDLYENIFEEERLIIF